MAFRLSVNEKSFIEEAVKSDQRIDGRRPFDYRRFFIKFSKEDGCAEVQLGHTHILAVVTGQIIQPFRDRPNEGTLSIYTEFSPMADPAFEFGRGGESSVELGRLIDRSLRESRAVDTESLCILSGKAVWALRLDITILDNGGNLIDAANIAALAALLSFRRPECSIGLKEDQEITIHPPDVRDPLPLIIHHLPIAITFGFFGEGDVVVLDPNYKEEAVMGGRMTVTMNTHGDVCAVHKAGGVGVSQGEVLRCFRIATGKATDVTNILKSAFEVYKTEREQKKIKRHKAPKASFVEDDFFKSAAEMITAVAGESKIGMPEAKGVKLETGEILENKDMDEDLFKSAVDMIAANARGSDESGNDEEEKLSKQKKQEELFSGGPSKWDPFSKGLSDSTKGGNSSTIDDAEMLDAVASSILDTENGTSLDTESSKLSQMQSKSETSVGIENIKLEENLITKEPQSLEDAVKPRAKKKKKKKNKGLTE